MKNIFALILSLSMLFSAQAMAGGNPLKEAYDDLTFSLTVEWDQKDQQFYDNQMELFASRIAALKNQGIDNQELINLALSQVSKNQAVELRNAFTKIEANLLTSVEISEELSKIFKQNANQGASWSTTATVVVSVVVVIAVVAIVAGQPIGGIVVKGGCNPPCDRTKGK